MLVLGSLGLALSIATTALLNGASEDVDLRTNPTRTPAPELGEISELGSVGPFPTDPLAGIERDVGKGIALGDGSTLWLFGDSARRDRSGRFDYFVIGTAAWSSREQPMRTIDYTLDGEPIELAVPTPDFPDCPEDAPVAGMWPESAVVVDVEDRERVIVWLGNVCLGEGGELAARGTAVAEWWYDPESPPVSRPLRTEVLRRHAYLE